MDIAKRNKARVFIVAIVLFITLVVFSVANREQIPENCREVETENGTIIECDTEQEVDVSIFSDITDELPIRRYNYEVSFITPEPSQDRIPILVTILPREFPIPSQDAQPTSAQYTQFINYVRQHRSAAINEFESLGFEKSRYDFYFNENYIIEDFDGMYVGDM